MILLRRFLNEFRKRSVVSKPELRYLCPVHETILNPGVWRSVRCIDCGISYRRTDCQTNLFLNRIKNPEKWPPSKGPTIYHPPPEREPPLWKDRRFLIPIILFVLHLPLTFYLHFNPYSPPDNAKTLAASAVTSESYVTEQIPDVTTSKSPSSSSATLDANHHLFINSRGYYHHSFTRQLTPLSIRYSDMASLQFGCISWYFQATIAYDSLGITTRGKS